MLGRLAKVVLNSTALAPVGLCYAWVGLIEGCYLSALAILYVCILLFLICQYMLTEALRYCEAERFSIISAECTDGEAIAMLLVYLLPLFTSQFSSLNWQLWVPALLLISFVVSTGHCFTFNPVLRMLGWHFYRVSTQEGISYILIAKSNITNALKLKTRIVHLTGYTLVEKQEVSK